MRKKETREEMLAVINEYLRKNGVAPVVLADQDNDYLREWVKNIRASRVAKPNNAR